LRSLIISHQFNIWTTIKGGGMKKFLLCIFFLAVFVVRPSWAKPIVTEIKQNGNSYAIVLNNAIRISGISLKNGNIDFPVYVSKGRIFKQLSILRRDYAKELSQTIIKGEKRETFEILESQIATIEKLKNHKNIYAFCNVIFESVLEVKCRVMKGKNGLWVSWPAIKQGGKWIKTFEFIDFHLKNEIETRLINAVKG
jgi:DNA-binding cell septation regulator SpoVG